MKQFLNVLYKFDNKKLNKNFITKLSFFLTALEFNKNILIMKLIYVICGFK